MQHRRNLGQESLIHQTLPSPFSFMRRFSEEMDRLFEDFGFGRGWLSPSMGELSPSGFRELGRAAWSPQVEVFRRGDELVVRCDLPGMRKEDVRVDIQEDQLILQGERSWESDQDREGVMRSERHYGSFYRVIPLPEGVRAGDARASYKDGVLEISMPAPEERPRGRRVNID
jgi:HSP20 family protein